MTRNILSRTGAFVALLGTLCSISVVAQPSDKELMKLDRTIDGLIRSIDDIVWTNITIYELRGDFKSELLASMQSEDSVDIQQLNRIGDIVTIEPIPNFATTAVAVARNARNFEVYKRQICGRYNEYDCEYDFDEDLLTQSFNLAASIVQNENNRPRNFYLVASRDRDEPRLIALLGINLETGRPSLTSFRKVGHGLWEFLQTNNNGEMYVELEEAVADGSPELANQMFLLRDFAELEIVDRTKALATYIDEEQYPFVLRSISNERPIREAYTPPPVEDTAAASDEPEFDFAAMLSGDGIFDDSKTGITVTEGAAVPGAVEHMNEAVLGTDVVAAYYSYQMTEEKTIDEVDWGIELINNFDQINYPSIWGGRLTLNALLRNVKIGAVLPSPRFGGATIGESGIFDKPQRIIGGYGAAFSGDFAFPVINNSGLFNFYASYTFGEADVENMAVSVYPNANDTSIGSRSVAGDVGHLIRYAFQGYYSFGFYADPQAQHLFRFKLGGAVYGVDFFERQQVFRQGDITNDTIPSLGKVADDVQGGVSGKIEYMKGGTTIPYGVWTQYFDGSLLSSVWLQFIVARNLDLKLQGKFFTPLFRDARPWEQNALVVPSLEVKYHFGAP